MHRPGPRLEKRPLRSAWKRSHSPLIPRGLSEIGFVSFFLDRRAWPPVALQSPLQNSERVKANGRRSRQNGRRGLRYGTRGEFDEALEYIHMNPVVKGLVQDSFAWPWSSARWFVERQGPVEIDQIRLPSGPKSRI